MHSLALHYDRKTRSDRGKKRPRESNASYSSTTLNHLSSSHPLDDSIDENDDESFHSNPSSPSQNISSSSNDVFGVHQNPPHESHYLNTYLTETINLQTQQRDAYREGLRSIGQALKNMMGGKTEVNIFGVVGLKRGLKDSYNPHLDIRNNERGLKPVICPHSWLLLKQLLILVYISSFEILGLNLV
ncbi:hypothetical protein Tco_0687902 [Tanacetum coccineum]